MAWIKNLIAKIKAIPHLFAKVTVVFCVLFGAACSIYALRIMAHSGHDAASLLGVILAFFGGELLLMCLKTIFKSPNGKDDKSDVPPIDNSTYYDRDD